MPGRALVQVDKKMFQIQLYLAFKGEKEFDRVNAIKEFVTDINDKYNEHCPAKRIPEMPRDLNMNYINNNFASNIAGRNIIMGISYETLLPTSWDITNGGLLTISGDDELGRGAFVKYIVSAIANGIIGQAKMKVLTRQQVL